jgi:hypothetical protein
VKILTEARAAAFELIQRDPQLKLMEHKPVKEWMEANQKLWIG